MLKITRDTTFGEVRNAGEFSDIAQFLIVQQPEEIGRTDRTTLAQACGKRTDFVIDSLYWLREQAKDNNRLIFDIWSEAEKDADPDKRMTGLLYFPGKPGNPYVIVCAGGAYVSVCNAFEGFPAAREFTEMGYHVFVLTYRVAKSPLLPGPQEDLAQAVRFIEKNAGYFRILPGDYAVCGFSAGGHLAASFWSTNMGYRRYGVPAPGALFLGYASSTARVFDMSLKIAQDYITTMIGDKWTEELLDKASVDKNMDASYPPVYAIHSMDDDTVPYESSLVLGRSLDRFGAPHELETVDGCGHGFSTGFEASEGWLGRAAEFWEKQRNGRWFRTKTLNDHITRITAACGEKMYLVEGNHTAALLDTGSGIGKLRDVVDRLTDKPVKVLLTHGHLDHAAAASQFDEVYMSAKDAELYKRHNGEFRSWFLKREFPDLVPYMESTGELTYTPIEDEDEWDLGGLTIRAYECAGHTKGSVVFLMVEDRILLLGDACNANTLVYDQDSTTVEEYRDSLKRLEEQTHGIYDHTIFSHDDCIKGTDIVRQMTDLCNAIMSGDSEEEPAEFIGQNGLRAKKTGEDRLPLDGSDVNIMYSKDRVFK